MIILIFGNSITQGFHDDECGGWPSRLAAYTNKKTLRLNFNYNVSVFNLGISGNNSEDLCSRLKSEIQPRVHGSKNENTIVIAIGVNDSQFENKTKENKVPIKDFINNLETLIKDTAPHTKNLIFLGPTPIQEEKLTPMPWKTTHSYDNQNLSLYDSSINQVCEKHNVAYLSMAEVFREIDLDTVLSDGIHPNSEGHRLIFEKVKNFLEERKLI